MNRAYIANALRTLAEKDGFTFVEAPAGQIAGLVAAYPVAWLEQIELQSKSGTHHGRIIYSVRLHLMFEGLRMPPAQRNETFDAAEQTMLKIFTELSTDARVACVDDLTIKVSQFARTPHGEIAVTADALIDTIY